MQIKRAENAGKKQKKSGPAPRIVKQALDWVILRDIEPWGQLQFICPRSRRRLRRRR